MSGSRGRDFVLFTAMPQAPKRAPNTLYKYLLNKQMNTVVIGTGCYKKWYREQEPSEIKNKKENIQ